MTDVSALRQEHEPALLLISQTVFEMALVRAAFDNLQISGPLCFNNFGYALRELLRHVFHRLAPDEQIKRCDWFKPDSTSKSTITRAHRSKYILQGGLSDYFVRQILKVEIRPAIQDVLAAFEVLNKFTHVNSDTFNLDQGDVTVHAAACLEATSSLIDKIGVCRGALLQKLAAALDQHILNKAIADVIGDLDELATHHLIEGVYTESTEVMDIGSNDLRIEVQGYVEVELQYGSGSDVRNDIGTVMSDSFPFSADLRVEFTRPLGKSTIVSNFKVDTSSWYGE